MTCNTISLVSWLIWNRFRWKFIDIFEDVCSLRTCFSADSFHLLCCIMPCESSGRFFRPPGIYIYIYIYRCSLCSRSWYRICHLTSTSLQSMPSSSFSFHNCSASDVLLTTTQPLPSSMHSYLGWLLWQSLDPICAPKKMTDKCSMFSMLQPESSPKLANMMESVSAIQYRWPDRRRWPSGMLHAMHG